MEPLGFSRGALWFTILLDDVTTDVLAEISDLPTLPGPEDVAGFGQMIGHAIGGDRRARLALLLVRPGGGGPTIADRTWAHALMTAARQADVTVAPVHLATDRDLVVIPDDEEQRMVG